MKVTVSNAIYPPPLTRAQVEALQDATTYNQAATVNQAAYNQAVGLDNPLYSYKDILSYPPYSLYCDCDSSLHLNPVLTNELVRIADQYNQRVCDLVQWYIISESVMPTLPDEPSRINLIEDLSKALYDEQARRQLTYLPEYPSFCNSVYPVSI